jgi:hypothetical protein
MADGHNRLSTQNWWCASRRLATCQQLVDPHLLGIHTDPQKNGGFGGVGGAAVLFSFFVFCDRGGFR